MLVFNKMHSLFFSFLLAFTGSITPVIVRWELKKLYDKELLYMGDLHNKPRFSLLEKEQLDYFVKKLEEYSLTSEKPVHIQIEHTDDFWAKESLITHLKAILEKKCLKNVSFENSEIRGASACAIDIRGFIKEYENETIDLSLINLSSNRSTNTHTFYVTQLTLQNIHDEYLSTMNNLNEKILSIENTEVKKVLLEQLSSATRNYLYLKEYYFDPLINNSTEPFVDLVQRELGTRPEYIKDFLDSNFQAAGRFFEISLFVGIFTHEAPFVIVIAGAGHIMSLNGIAAYIPYNKTEFIAFKGDSIWSNDTKEEDIPVVQISDFTFFEKGHKKIEEPARWCVLF